MPNQSASEDGIIIRADSRTTLTVVALAALSAAYPVIAANLLSVSNVSFELFRARLSDNIGAVGVAVTGGFSVLFPAAIVCVLASAVVTISMKR